MGNVETDDDDDKAVVDDDEQGMLTCVLGSDCDVQAVAQRNGAATSSNMTSGSQRHEDSSGIAPAGVADLDVESIVTFMHMFLLCGERQRQLGLGCYVR